MGGGGRPGEKHKQTSCRKGELHLPVTSRQKNEKQRVVEKQENKTRRKEQTIHMRKIDFNREKEQEYRIEIAPHVVIEQKNTKSHCFWRLSLNLLFFWSLSSSSTQLHGLPNASTEGPLADTVNNPSRSMKEFNTEVSNYHGE